MASSPLEHHRIHTNGVTLHVVQAGPADGPLAILLHGFPEFWRAWIHQVDVLAGAGYRVWIPDQRGYNTSDKPEDVSAYGIHLLVDDIRGLIGQSGRERAALLGHDWGGAVAWRLAARHPECVERLVVVNCPHPAVMRGQLKWNPRQLRRSWYMFFFQLPRLPELWLRRRDCAALVKALRATSRAGTFDDASIAEYREAWRQPGAITAMVNWYRAMRLSGRSSAGSLRVRVPALLVWGLRDFALGAELAAPSIAHCDDGELVFVENAGHWVLHEKPQRVNALLLDFLARNR